MRPKADCPRPPRSAILGVVDATRATVAVVDDDESVRSALRRLLRSVGLGVRVFASAEDFLGAGTPPPDCLVLDVCMPGLGGLSLQERLAGEGRPIPIVFITGRDDERARRAALARGAVGYLKKPFDDECLLEAVARGRAQGGVADPAPGASDG